MFSGSRGQLETVKAAAVVGIFYKLLVEKKPDLVPVLPDIQLERSYWIVMHQSNRGSAQIRAVANFLETVTTEERSVF